MIRATVITDASFCHRSLAGGWATWINVNGENGEHERIKEAGVFHQAPRTSTQAELWACYNGIWIAYQRGARDILVQTDCLSLVQTRPAGYGFQRTQHWPEASVKWKHVKAHTIGADRRTWCNNWCDTEAKKHMRRQRDHQPNPTRKDKRWKTKCISE